jgi:hypothetical protein
MNTRNNSASRPLLRLAPALAALAGALALGCDLNATSVDADPAHVDVHRYEQGVNGATLADENCPFEQWDCSQLSAACARDVSLGAALGCVCNRSRPVTVAECGPDESLFCLTGSGSSSRTLGTARRTFSAHAPQVRRMIASAKRAPIRAWKSSAKQRRP